LSALALAAHQFRFDQRIFWRNPASVFFTVLFPVMFLILFEVIFGDGSLQGLHVDANVYYVPAILTLAVVSATFQTLAMSVTLDREDGILKRTRGTPLPSWVFIAGRVGNSIVVSLVMLALMTLIGGLLYGVDVPWERAPAVLITLAVGASAFCCLGLALTAAIPSANAAAPTWSSSPCTSSLACSCPRARSPTGSSTSPRHSRSGPSSRRSSPRGAR
jgi:ABC-2 type transport system permease protein